MLAPAGAAAILRRAKLHDVGELVPGEIAELRGMHIEATAADHDERRLPFGARATPIGFLVRGDRQIYFAGDTDLFAGMEKLGPVDIALLPVAGWGPKLGPGHMNAERAARAAQLLRPGIAVPIHWGTLHPRWRSPGSWFKDPPNVFAKKVEELAPDVDVRVLSPGESLEV